MFKLAERNGCGPNLTLFLCHALLLSGRSLCFQRGLLARARGNGTSCFTTLDTRVSGEESNDDGGCDDDDDDDDSNVFVHRMITCCSPAAVMCGWACREMKIRTKGLVNNINQIDRHSALTDIASVPDANMHKGLTTPP